MLVKQAKKDFNRKDREDRAKKNDPPLLATSRCLPAFASL
jgi:hypothetical protein